MFITLHSKKEKNSLSKWRQFAHYTHTSRIQRLWINLVILFRENFVAEYPVANKNRKKSIAPNPSHSSMEIDKIAQNQWAYSKLLQEKMNATFKEKRKNKLILMRS